MTIFAVFVVFLIMSELGFFGMLCKYECTAVHVSS